MLGYLQGEAELIVVPKFIKKKERNSKSESLNHNKWINKQIKN